MSDEQAQVATPTDPAPVQDTAADSPPGGFSVGDLPADVQALIKELRAENAKHRTAKKEAEKQAAELQRKQAEEQGEFKGLYEKALAELTEARQAAQAAEQARLKAEVAHRLQLPAALVDRLRGDTVAELEADARLLLDALPRPATGNTGGRDGLNASAPTPAKSDAEIREEAARLGLSYQHLKQFYEQRGN